MKRAKTFDKELRDEVLKSKKHRQKLLMGLLNGKRGQDVEKALGNLIRQIGVRDFARLAGVQAPNVAHFLSGQRRITQETLDKYLKPFGLKTKLTVMKVN